MAHHEPAERTLERDGTLVVQGSGQPLLLAFPRVKPDDPVGQVILAAVRGAVSRIAARDPDARRGDAEGIHGLRTATRRLRSELGALEDLVGLHWRDPIEGELKWLAGLLGGVRDLDVLTARLHKAASTKNEQGPDVRELAPLFTSLAARHELASRALAEGLQSDRYRALLATLERAGSHPALTDAAWEPCRTALPPVALAAWRRLKKAARSLRADDPVEEFHELRKRAQRARYTAELIAPVLGPHIARSARRFIRLTTQVQATLGEHQDAVVSGEEIERALAAHPNNVEFRHAAERLLDTERETASDARAAFFRIWDKLDRKKTRRWMKTPQPARAKA
jgi:CHAD domain-containing protein